MQIVYALMSHEYWKIPQVSYWNFLDKKLFLETILPFFFLVVDLLLTRVVTWRTNGSKVFSTDIVRISRFFGSLRNFQYLLYVIGTFVAQEHVLTHHRAAIDPTISLIIVIRNFMGVLIMQFSHSIWTQKLKHSLEQ